MSYDTRLQPFDDGNSLFVTPNGIFSDAKVTESYRGRKIYLPVNAVNLCGVFRSLAEMDLKANKIENIDIFGLLCKTSATPGKYTYFERSTFTEISPEHGNNEYARVIYQDISNKKLFLGKHYVHNGDGRLGGVFCAFSCACDAANNIYFRAALLGGKYDPEFRGVVINPKDIITNAHSTQRM